jgi:peptide/nickel transport system ATP-binding protein
MNDSKHEAAERHGVPASERSDVLTAAGSELPAGAGRDVLTGGRSDVLTVRGLTVSVRDKVLVEDVDLTVGPGERVGLIGESGSGKSLTALSVLGLLPEDVHAKGSVRLSGIDHDLIGADERQLSRIRGRDLAMVFQEPMTALNPTMRIGDQIAEAMLIHNTVRGRSTARAAANDLLERVQLPAVARAYPHQLSGGQRQRVVVAIALANDPALLICDEPTTALDVTVQAMILDLILQGVAARESALLFITHDLAVVATICQRVLVMYGGRVVESGPVHEVFTTPRHRYTQGLLAASDLDTAADRLPTIPGNVPPAGAFPTGCVFRTRCPHATDLCTTTPPWTGTPTQGHACHHPAPTSEERVSDE